MSCFTACYENVHYQVIDIFSGCISCLMILKSEVTFFGSLGVSSIFADGILALDANGMILYL